MFSGGNLPSYRNRQPPHPEPFAANNLLWGGVSEYDVSALGANESLKALGRYLYIVRLPSLSVMEA